MMLRFNHYYPTVDEIDIHFSDVLSVLHETDLSTENPIVVEVMKVFDELGDISDIRGGYVIFDDIEILRNQGKIRIDNQVLEPHQKICGYMGEAEKMAVFICTAGEKFSLLSNQYNKEGDYLKGYIVDTFGSIVVGKGMDYIQAQLEMKMRRECGMKITNRYSPGYCNWLVADQKQLFSLIPQNECEITLSPSCLMLPIKSISGIIGIGKGVTKSNYSCDVCSNITCVYRKVRNKSIQH